METYQTAKRDHSLKDIVRYPVNSPVSGKRRRRRRRRKKEKKKKNQKTGKFNICMPKMGRVSLLTTFG